MPVAQKILAALVVFALGGAWSAARAQVFEIQPDGRVVKHDGPAVYLSPDQASQPLVDDRASADAGSIRPRAEVTEAIRVAALHYGLSEDLVAAVAWQESHFNQRARSPKGAAGVMQLMPATAVDLGVDAANLDANIQGGTAYLAGLIRQFDGDLTLALAAYNAGPEAVRRYAGVPPFRETRTYVASTMERLARAADARVSP